MRRRIAIEPIANYFKPLGVPMNELEIVFLTHEELEVIRLIDKESLEQEDAATKMGVSRRTLARSLHDAREKIADAIINGKAIEIKKE